MNTGYVKLWRKTLKSPVWQNPKLFRFWAWCLMKASHKERVALVGFQEIPLLPGQFIFGRKKAAAETGLSEKSVRTCLDCLKSLENVTIKTASKYSVLTVVKTKRRGQQNDQQRASKGPAKGHRQECKECKT
jgi:hypothetical protein